MQKDRNVPSDDNKNAISLDNILDEFDSNSNDAESSKAGKNLSDAMKKLDEMFNREAEDLAWLNNIMNGTSDSDENTKAENGDTIPDKSNRGTAVIPDEVIPDEDAFSDIEQSEEEASDISLENENDISGEENLFSDLNIITEAEPEAADAESLVLDEDIFASDDENADSELSEDETELPQYSEVLRAENPDLDGFVQDDTKIFTSSSEKDNTHEDFSEQDAADQDYTTEESDGTDNGENAPDFDMFENGNGEYADTGDADSTQESTVDSSLGKLFGVDIPEEDTGKKKSAKAKSEHTKIAKELGAYEEINMADPDAVGAAKKSFTSRKRFSMIALLGTTFFMLISLYLELSAIGLLPVPGFMNVKTNPTIFALIDLQAMCFGAIFVIDSLADGFYAMLDKRFSPGSCALTVFFACAVQAVVSAVFGLGVKTELFCCIGCLALFMLALYNSLKASADSHSFSIASSTSNKYGAYELGVDSIECSPFASHIDLENAKVISVNKGSVYEGFVGRNEKRPEGEKKLGKLTLIISAIAILVGVFVALFSNGNTTERFYEGITGAVIVIAGSIPFNLFFVAALPKYIAVKKGKKINSTLIGQNASEEYKGLSVVAFEDTEVFLPKDVRISSIKTYGGMALDEAVITMSNIYNKIGGPLSKIFAKMVDIKNLCSDVRLVKVYPDAIEVNVDGRDITLATASYLGANGIRIINDSVDASFEQSHGSILFLVCSGRVLSKFYIKYSMNPIFEKTLRELHDANLCIGIKTLDPCITNDLVFGCLERANYALSVIKGNSSNDIPTVKNKVDSGVISLGSVHSFLEMLLICEKTGRNVKVNKVIKLISAILCTALSTVFVLTNNGSLNIVFCLLLQLFWLLPVTAVSYLNK